MFLVKNVGITTEDCTNRSYMKIK